MNFANYMSVLKGWGGYAAAGIVRLKALAPYALIELILPGGSLVALLLWLYRRRKDGVGLVLAVPMYDRLRTGLPRRAGGGDAANMPGWTATGGTRTRPFSKSDSPTLARSLVVNMFGELRTQQEPRVEYRSDVLRDRHHFGGITPDQDMVRFPDHRADISPVDGNVRCVWAAIFHGLSSKGIDPCKRRHRAQRRVASDLTQPVIKWDSARFPHNRRNWIAQKTLHYRALL
jgi:hypothetical protein